MHIGRCGLSVFDIRLESNDLDVISIEGLQPRFELHEVAAELDEVWVVADNDIDVRVGLACGDEMAMVRTCSRDWLADDVEDPKIISQDRSATSRGTGLLRSHGVVGRCLIGLLAGLARWESSLVGRQSKWREDLVAIEITRFLVKGIDDIGVCRKILKQRRRARLHGADDQEGRECHV